MGFGWDSDGKSDGRRKNKNRNKNERKNQERKAKKAIWRPRSDRNDCAPSPRRPRPATGWRRPSTATSTTPRRRRRRRCRDPRGFCKAIRPAGRRRPTPYPAPPGRGSAAPVANRRRCRRAWPKPASAAASTSGNSSTTGPPGSAASFQAQSWAPAPFAARPVDGRRRSPAWPWRRSSRRRCTRFFYLVCLKFHWNV